MSSIRRGSQSADQDARRATSAMLALTPLGVSTRASPRSARRGATRAKPVAPRRRDPDLVPSRLGDARLVSTRAGPNGFEEVDIDSIGAPGDDPRPPPPPSSSSSSSSPLRARLQAYGRGHAWRQGWGQAPGGFHRRGRHVPHPPLRHRRRPRVARHPHLRRRQRTAQNPPRGSRGDRKHQGGEERRRARLTHRRSIHGCENRRRGSPRPGYLIAADVVATVEETGAVVVDTRKRRRQVVFTYGRAQGPISRGVLEAVGEMRQGGRRIVVVPPEMGFGDEGAVLAEGNVPPGATVRYDIELARVSVPPS